MNLSKSAEAMTVVFSAGGTKHSGVILVSGFSILIYPILLISRQPKDLEAFSITYFLVIFLISAILGSETAEIIFNTERITVSKYFLGLQFGFMSFDIEDIQSIYVTRKPLPFYRGLDTIKRKICLIGGSFRYSSGALSEREAVRFEKELKTWLQSNSIKSIHIN